MKKAHLFILLLITGLTASAQVPPTAPDGYEWSDNLVANYSLSTSDLSSFQCSGDGATMKIVTTDGRKAIEVVSGAYKGNSWDNQFFIRLGDTFHEGDRLYVSFSYKAETSVMCSTEAHHEPGVYNHWEMLGGIDFTTSWNTRNWELEITAQQAGSSTGNDGLQAIAFDLNSSTELSNKYYFRDVVVSKLREPLQNCSSLIINEIQVANNDLYIDPSYNYGAWIELYNPGNKAISLYKFYVSDDATNLRKFRMPSNAGTVPAHGFKNIWFDHNSADGSFSSQASNQVRFKLDMDGGTIYLSNPDGQLVESVTYPPATPRCSYARQTDGGKTWGTTSTPTPERTNRGIHFATERLEAPVVSHDGGIFEEGNSVNFEVSIPAGATLRYTTDGSTPTVNNGVPTANGRFTVDTTTIYRFCLLQDGKLPSPVVTRSFIFKNHDYYLPVLSLSTRPENLFDDQIGLYVKGKNGISGRGQDTPCNWNRDWERPVNVEYFVPQQNSEGTTSFISVLNQETGFEICGGWSRGFHGADTDGHHWDAKSSFRLKTSKYFDGPNELQYAVFPNKPYNKYKAWQVRNGGNDEAHRVKDPILQQTVMSSGIDIDCQDYQPCHVFMNGLYLGMLNIREASNKQYGYSNFGIDTDDMDQFENWGDFKAGDKQAWNELQSRANRLASSQSESDYEAVKELLDVDEFINYMAVQCYFGGSDWLTTSYTNNIKAYRSRSDGGRFRFVMYDIDSALEQSDYWLSTFSYIVDGRINGDLTGSLFRSLIKYEAFRRQFLDTMCLVEGSVLVPSRVEEVAERICENTRTALSFEGLLPADEVSAPLGSRYKGPIVDNMVKHSIYGLRDPYWLQLSSNIEGGQFLLNGLRVPTGKFNGRAYNYKGIYLQSQAPAGYRFLGWKSEGINIKSLFSKGSSWDYYDKGSMDDYDWTSPDFNASSHGWTTNAPSPFGYGNSGSYPRTNAKTTLDYGGDSNNKRPTYYFRKTIYLDSQPAAEDVFTLSYHVDDGFALYVNGQFVHGFRVSEGEAKYDFVTTDYAGGTPDAGTITLDPSIFKKGYNTLAVEVHNNSRTSSDIFWDCSLQHTSYGASSIISTEPTFCLSDAPAGGYSLTAMYEQIEEPRKRYEAGGTPIRINEVSAGNDIYINEYHKKNDWIELYNTTDEDIDLAGLYLSDNAKKPQKWQIGSTVASTIIPAHATRIVWCDDLEPISQLHAPFKLDNADGACVSIQSADGSWADQLTYLSQPRWQTYGRYPDGGNFASLLSLPTIDRSNMYGIIDYTMYDPAEDPESAITLALADGWNWTSHNLGTNVSMSRFNYYALEARSQTEENICDDQSGWQGSLKDMIPSQGYKLRMKQAADITLRGHLFDTSQPISLQHGWNWMGVPLQNATALTAALKDYQATEGDQIVGLDQFAIFENGTWNGTLTKLEPGQAYLFKVGQAQTLRWNDLSQGAKARERRYAAAQREDTAPWFLNIHAYPNVMTMVAKLDTEELNLQANYYVGAFCDNECRGVAKAEDGILYMNIHGEGDEKLQFHLLDAEGNLFKSKETTSLTSMRCLGSVNAPYILHFGQGDIEDVIFNDTMAAQTQAVSIQYFNLNGQRILQPQGVCVERIQMSDGTVVVRKLRK